MDGNQTPTGQSELPQPVQPGQTITPGGVTPAATPEALPPASVTPQPAPQPPLPAPETAEVPVQDITTQPQPVFATSNSPDTAPEQAAAQEAYGAPVSWTASEFIAHDKSPNWYVILFGGAVIVAGANWLIFKDILSSVVIIAAVLILAAYSKRQPRELQYVIGDEGIEIGPKHYAYGHFRSFSIIDDGAFSSIELMPLKRFSPPISIYYDPADEDAIAEALTPHLPYQPVQPDPIDKLIRRIRF
ncbi:MAG: hypothetical protein ABIR37_02765 [Candidatus Saccharimonadales bacterium]